MNLVGRRAGGSSAGVAVPERCGDESPVSEREAKMPDRIAVPSVPALVLIAALRGMINSARTASKHCERQTLVAICK